MNIYFHSVLKLSWDDTFRGYKLVFPKTQRGLPGLKKYFWSLKTKNTLDKKVELEKEFISKLAKVGKILSPHPAHNINLHQTSVGLLSISQTIQDEP